MLDKITVQYRTSTTHWVTDVKSDLLYFLNGRVSFHRRSQFTGEPDTYVNEEIGTETFSTDALVSWLTGKRFEVIVSPDFKQY